MMALHGDTLIHDPQGVSPGTHGLGWGKGSHVQVREHREHLWLGRLGADQGSAWRNWGRSCTELTACCVGNGGQ